MRKHFFRFNYLCAIVLLIFSSNQLIAQTQVKGRVTDAATGEPLIGATIVENNTSNGTVSDMSGNYQITVQGTASVLKISYVSYESQEIMVGNETIIDVQLVESATELEDVVVIGYGTVRKEDLTGSIAVVSSEDLNRTPASNFQKALQGKAPGVLVTSNTGAPGSGASIKVRGIGSISSNGDPIYVIDGIVTGSLNSINPADIETMQVLKDASATAIYGADGANGVIIITTKRGESGDTRVSYGAYYSVNRIPKKLNLMNADQYADFYNEIYAAQDLSEYAYTDEFRQFYYGDGWQQGTDWQDAVTQQGYRHNEYIRISGGGNNNNFSVSGNFFDEKGIIINTGAKRYNFRANSDFKISDRIKVGETFNISRLITQNGAGLFGNPNGGGVFNDANIASPLMKIYNPDNKEGFEGPQIPFEYDIDPSDTIVNQVNNTGGNDKFNPVAQGSLSDNYSYSNAVLGNLYAELTLFDWLKYKASFSITMNNGRTRIWTPSYKEGVRSSGQARLEERFSESVGIQLENQLSFNKNFGDHTINAIAVQQVRKSEGTGATTIGTGFNYEYVNYNFTYAENISATGYLSPYRMLSYLGRVIYDYQKKVFLTGSIRRDGVSVFGAENRWGNFPSASIAYKINEDFLQNVQQINLLKLRVGWGLTGNSDIGSFQYDDFLGDLTDFHPVFGIPNQSVTGLFVFTSFGNPLIRWESAEMLNFGFDINAFDNKIQASAEYYIKNQNDLLVKKEVPLAFGRATTAIAPFANIGQNRNTGVEAQLTYRNYEGSFQYSTSINFTSIKNTVISLPVKNIIIGNNITLEGHTIGSLYGWVAERIITEDDFDGDGNYLYARPATGDPSPGDLKFKDLNNDGVITDLDRTIIGKPLPDYIFGWSFECSWKNFDFSIFLNSMLNYQVYNYQRSTIEAFVGQDIDHNKLLDFALNHYTTDRPSTEYVRADPDNSNDNVRISTWWVEDASFLRIRDLQLGYNLPANVLSSVGIDRTRIYISAENPWVFTKYKGRDPEIAAFNTDGDNNYPTNSGTDRGGFPNPRVITFGVQADF